MFEYPCPDCGATDRLHEPRCAHEHTAPSTIERAYIDIISPLSSLPKSKEKLESMAHGGWTDLHDDCFSKLWEENRIQIRSDGTFELVKVENRDRSIHPTEKPLKTIFEVGTVPGAHDNGVCALIAWYANKNMNWRKTKDQLKQWFDRTNSWERGGFDEPTIDDVLEKKKHIWEEQYGWTNMGEAARNVILAEHPAAAPDADADTASAGA